MAVGRRAAALPRALASALAGLPQERVGGEILDGGVSPGAV